MSAPIPSRPCGYVCCASRPSCCNFLRRTWCFSLQSFCDPFCPICIEILHCCAVFLLSDLEVCDVMLQIFCVCFVTYIHSVSIRFESRRSNIPPSLHNKGVVGLLLGALNVFSYMLYRIIHKVHLFFCFLFQYLFSITTYSMEQVLS
jgi:hypothetical protein